MLTLATCVSVVLAASAPAAEKPIPLTEGLAISGVSRPGRVPISVDAVQSMIARGVVVSPSDGDVVEVGGRKATWRKVKAGEDGRLPVGSYLYAPVDVPEACTMLLKAASHGMVYVNGEPHAGDPYGYGYLTVPVKLRAGLNRFLFAGGRGGVKADLVPVEQIASLDPADLTMPDVLTTDKGKLFGAVVVINAGHLPLKGAVLTTTFQGREAKTRVPTIPPLSTRKVRVDVPLPAEPTKGDAKASIELTAGDSRHSVEVGLRVLEPTEVHKRTFVSKMDGSVQYYAVNPARKPSKGNMLVLSVHGASVEGLGQAQAYASHDDWTLVAATNRRPYGFDWEDWGRTDAMEVLEIAEKTIPHDPRRVVLTGHSMGGHGTWHLGLTYPDKFAAIGPSAGWSSFFSYAGSPRIAPDDAVAEVMSRAMTGSDTLGLVRNALTEDVYILHGDADDNVPVTEARLMRDALLKVKSSIGYHEQPGAGHWWGIEQGPGWGSACVDWKPMFEMFQKARLPLDKDVKELEFTTANPAVSGKFRWATVEQQIRPSAFGTIKLRREGKGVVGTTDNVAALRLDLTALGGIPDKLVLDGQNASMSFRTGRPPKAMVAYLRNGKWVCEAYREVSGKSSRKGGPFKQAFTRNMAFVYGTKGNADENAWAFAKARFDAEQWQYRGNGAVDVIPDTDLNPKAKRNVILYGNADTNGAWSRVLKGCPIEIVRGKVRVGRKTVEGDDLGCIFLYPKSGDADGLVGVVSGTGPAGFRSVERLAVFSAGVAYPDWMVVGVDALQNGLGGIRGAGFFGNDWKVESGDSAWR